MPKYSDFTAVIFDMDDTLINNYPPGHPDGLHEESRLLAIHEVGKRHDVPQLRAFTAKENVAAFREAPIHSLESAVWNALYMCGLVPDVHAIDTTHPLFREIVDRKEVLHEEHMRRYAIPVPGATEFVRALAAQGFADKMAIASTAFRRDIFIALEILGLANLFPEKRVISKDMFTHAKPHPEVFELAAASFGPAIPHDKIAAFEDHPRGVVSAKAAELFTCAITTCFSKKDLAGQPIAPDLIAGSYEEFAELLGLPFPAMA